MMIDYIGQQFGNYQLLRLLGRGAFAEVYLAEHRYLEVPAAIKVLHVQMEPVVHEQFRREAYTIAHLQHPHIVRVLDFGVQDQTPFLVIEYIPGGTLRSQHPRGTALPPELIISYVEQIAGALDYAHRQHVIHRDIKPENILLNAGQELVLSDFGLAFTQRSMDSLATQNQAGTPLYMAPEQFQGRPCTASDQYAVGVLVYEWICGDPPFVGTFYQLGYQHLYQSPPSLCAQLPLLPAAVENAVFRALAKDPRERYACVQDFAGALKEGWELTQTLVPGVPSALAQNVSTAPRRPFSSRERDVAVRQEQVTLAPLPAVVTSQRTVKTEATSQRTVRTEVTGVQETNRLRLLRRVRTFWITGVLEHSLHGAALIAMGLEEQPGAVVNPWQLVLRHPGSASRSFPVGTRIKDIYDEANGELLILGAPGSGKTTLLLELARDLLDQAERDEHHPIPVVFNLSTWAAKQQRLVDWFVEELTSKYQVPRKLGQVLVDAELILPLLDGLDEVSPRERTACIKVINSYRQEHGLVPLVVCSRQADYLAQSGRLQLDSAVVVQPLTEQQINDHLARGGEPLRALRLALQQDAELRELARTPLMLSILTLTYYNMPVEQLLQMPSSEAKQRQVFERYVEQMLTPKGAKTHYTLQQTTHWLSWLARQLARHSQGMFYIERMQPDWLEDQNVHRHYLSISVGLIFAMIGALCLGPVSGLIFAPSVWSGIFLGLALLFGLISGTCFGVLNGFIYEQGEEKRRGGRMRWMWKRTWARIVRGTLNGWLIGLLVGLPYGLSLWRLQGSDRLIYILATGGIIGLLGGLAFILIDGFLSIKATEIRPAETLGWSWIGMGRNLVKFLILGLLGSLLIGLLFALFSGLYDWVIHGMKNIQSVLPGILPNELQFAEAFSPFFALVGGLLGALTGGWSGDILDERNLTTPNQGIRSSARHSVLIGIVGMVVGGVLGGLLGQIQTGIHDPKLFLTYGLIFGPLIGLVSGLRAGGTACIQHAVLRWLLWRAGYTSWNYPRFLDYAAERILLSKVGGGYIFVHRLLLEYFASLNTTRTSSLAEVEPAQVRQIKMCICGYPYRPGARFCPNCGRPQVE